MGAPTYHHPPVTTPENDFHAAIRRRHEHHHGLHDLLHHRLFRPLIAVLLLSAIGIASYRIASTRAEQRLTAAEASHRSALDARRSEAATLAGRLEREDRRIRRNLARENALTAQQRANRNEIERAWRSIVSLEGELQENAAALEALDDRLSQLRSENTGGSDELQAMREQQSLLLDEQNRLRIQIQRLSARLEAARAERAEEERLESFRRSRP